MFPHGCFFQKHSILHINIDQFIFAPTFAPAFAPTFAPTFAPPPNNELVEGSFGHNMSSELKVFICPVAPSLGDFLSLFPLSSFLSCLVPSFLSCFLSSFVRCGFHGGSTVASRGPHGSSMGVPRGLHGGSMGAPWRLHGGSIGIREEMIA